MNDDLFNNDSMENEVQPEYHSEPYRIKYEHGELLETFNPSSDNHVDTQQQNTYYDTYNYNSETATETVQASDTPEKPKKKHPFLKAVKWMACAACFGVIAGAAFLGTNYFASEAFGIDLGLQESYAADGTSSTGNSTNHFSDNNNATQLNVTLSTTSPIESAKGPAESVVVQVVEENMPATVAVKSTYLATYSYWGQQYQKESQASGSGFIVGINETELLIATNNHVIEDSTKIEITFIDDTVLEASIKGTDVTADLAIIAVPLDTISAETLSKIRVATLGDSDEVRLGEMAIAIGNALGYGQSVTVGYISAKDRKVTVDGNTMVLLQTDAAINGGNSGGPLFNTRGEVIGINSVKYASTDVEGMCFAIPISRATPILNELMTRETLTDEEKGFLGIGTKTVTDDIATFYGWPIGAYVSSVVEGSPAEASKIYVGDIITGVNGIKIVTADQLVSAISSYRYGTTVELTVQRLVNGKYEELKISATLAKRADALAANEETSSGSNSSED